MREGRGTDPDEMGHLRTYPKGEGGVQGNRTPRTTVEVH